jgi:hypothetical protein
MPARTQAPPTLELQPDCLERPTQLDVAIVENMMLWPHDPHARERAEQAAMAQFGRNLMTEGRLSRDLEQGLVHLAVEAPKPGDVQETAKLRFVEGCIAGYILDRAISWADFDPDKAAIQKTVEAISDKLWPQWRLRPRTIQNKMTELRCVSHLWAAYVRDAMETETPFPCRSKELAMFLGTAEAYREWAERTRTPHSPSTVLRPGETVRLPAGLCVPKVELEFQRPV